jgi:hypothetical protein
MISLWSLISIDCIDCILIVFLYCPDTIILISLVKDFLPIIQGRCLAGIQLFSKQFEDVCIIQNFMIASSHQIFQKCQNFLLFCVGIIYFEKFDGNLN